MILLVCWPHGHLARGLVAPLAHGLMALGLLALGSGLLGPGPLSLWDLGMQGTQETQGPWDQPFGNAIGFDGQKQLGVQLFIKCMG